MHSQSLHSFCAFLAATADGTLFLDLLPWLLLLGALVIVGGILMYAAKRLARSGDDAGSEGFTLQSLRDLHAAGELSDEEFAKAKAAMIGQVRKAAVPENAPPSDSTIDDAPADKSAKKASPERPTNGSNGM